MSKPIYHYTAYGLAIASELPLPELIQAPAAAAGGQTNGADIVIRLGVQEKRPEAGAVSGRCYHTSPQETLIYWDDGGLCAMRGGREIIFEPREDADERAVRLYLLGTAMAVLLQQRGLLVLHASAVVVGSAAAAFMGDCGMGKSTTAAALTARGHALLADDVIAADSSPGRGTRVWPAFPQMKLCFDAAQVFCDDAAALPLVHPKEEKRVRRMEGAFAAGPDVPLGRVYILGDADQRRIVRLPVRQAFMELVRYSFVGRILRSIGAAPQHMDQCTHLVGAVPVCRLERPRDLGALDELAKLVEADMAQS